MTISSPPSPSLLIVVDVGVADTTAAGVALPLRLALAGTCLTTP